MLRPANLPTSGVRIYITFYGLPVDGDAGLSVVTFGLWLAALSLLSGLALKVYAGRSGGIEQAFMSEKDAGRLTLTPRVMISGAVKRSCKIVFCLIICSPAAFGVGYMANMYLAMIFGVNLFG